MINKLSTLLQSLVLKLWHSLKRFPEAIFMTTALVSILIILNHNSMHFDKTTLETLKRLAMIFALGIPLFLSIKVLFERLPKLKSIDKLMIFSLALIFQLLYYLFLLKDFQSIPVLRYIAISLSLYLVFVIIPQLKNKATYELYVISLLYRFIITYFYSLILYGGISAILFTIDKLFSINISGKLYFDMFLIVAGIFAPIFFLGDIPESEKKIDVLQYPKVFKILLLYILLPILTVYSLILYVYFAKAIFTFNLPKGIIGNLVLWYSIISTIVTFFIYPLKEINNWAKTFLIYFPKLILPLLAMLFVSIGIRISYFGITEPRYYVIVVALWVTGSMIYLALKKNARNINLLISLAIISTLTVVGPWSSFSTSNISQNNRFDKILNSNNMLVNGVIVKTDKEVSDVDKVNLSSIVRYFENKNGLSKLNYIPKDFTINDMDKVFGFDMFYLKGETLNGSYYFNLMSSSDSAVSNIKGYDYLLDFSNLNKPSDLNFTDGQFSFEYSLENKKLIIKQNKVTIYSKNLADIALKIHDKFPQGNVLSKEEMTFSEENDKLIVRYEFTNINGNVDTNSNETTIDWIQLKALIKVK